MTHTPETPDPDDPETDAELEVEVADDADYADEETEDDIEADEDPDDPDNYDPVEAEPPTTTPFQEEDMPKNAQPAIVNSRFKGVKQLVHVERGKARVGEKENYTSAVLYLYPGVNYLADDATKPGDEAKRATIWAKLVETNAAIQQEVKAGRFEVLESLESQPEDRIIALTIQTGRREDLRFILENDDRPEVQQAAQDELDALKEATTQEEEYARNQRRLRRRHEH